MTDKEIETLYWGTAQLYSPMANHAAVIVAFARMIEAREREACAKVCDQLYEGYGPGTGMYEAKGCAAAIRARSD